MVYIGLDSRPITGEAELVSVWVDECGDYVLTQNYGSRDLPVHSSGSNRVAVYLDCPAGTLSFYEVSSDSLKHIYTVQKTFTEPLYPMFMLLNDDSSVRLCEDSQITSLIS